MNHTSLSQRLVLLQPSAPPSIGEWNSSPVALLFLFALLLQLSNTTRRGTLGTVSGLAGFLGRGRITSCFSRMTFLKLWCSHGKVGKEEIQMVYQSIVTISGFRVSPVVREVLNSLPHLFSVIAVKVGFNCLPLDFFGFSNTSLQLGSGYTEKSLFLDLLVVFLFLENCLTSGVTQGFWLEQNQVLLSPITMSIQVFM